MLVDNRIHQLLKTALNNVNTVVLPAESLPQPRIWQNDESVIFELDIPGRNAEDINVTTERNVVRVGWQNLEPPENVVRLNEREPRGAGVEFHVPFSIDAEKTDVVLGKGILRVTLTQPEQERPRKVAVKKA